MAETAGPRRGGNGSATCAGTRATAAGRVVTAEVVLTAAARMALARKASATIPLRRCRFCTNADKHQNFSTKRSKGFSSFWRL
jgi:hypothetical protein